MKYTYIFLIAVSTLIFSSCDSDDTPKGDTQSPTSPLNLMSTGSTDTTVDLSWEEASDNVAVTGYNLYQDGVIAQSNLTGTSTSVAQLMADTPYSFYVTAIDEASNESDASNTASLNTAVEPLQFLQNLSEMGVYTGDFSNLIPADGVQLYEINSTLFSDYSSKQRLVKLPEGESMTYDNSDLLPLFPENTLIAKTFYYNIDDRDPSLGQQIIETRLLLKLAGAWQVGNYKWNVAQTDASLIENGSGVDISYIDLNGDTNDIDYEIPSNIDCATCHNNNGSTRPIGIKLRNMNFIPSYTGQNQIDYFKNIGLLNGLITSDDISSLPDWTDDTNYDIFERGRAYIDINCAHCHQPGGEVTNFDLDFRYETLFNDSGIYANRGEIEERIQSNTPTYRMPQLGRSIVHAEAVAMLLEYLQAIED
jgi:uncharacterized repeat protein (TIGR03806 family)